MTDSATLLRMLEPAVRPVLTPGSGRSQSLPLEQRSFESLLSEVKQNEGATQPTQEIQTDATNATNTTPATTVQTAETPQRIDPFAALRQFSAIDNASLRSQMK